jgi:hypothetical protein
MCILHVKRSMNLHDSRTNTLGNASICSQIVGMGQAFLPLLLAIYFAGGMKTLKDAAKMITLAGCVHNKRSMPLTCCKGAPASCNSDAVPLVRRSHTSNSCIQYYNSDNMLAWLATDTALSVCLPL